jgi:hypothetical protein
MRKELVIRIPDVPPHSKLPVKGLQDAKILAQIASYVLSVATQGVFL